MREILVVSVAMLCLGTHIEGTVGPTHVEVREMLRTVSRSVIPFQVERHGTLTTICSAITLSPITALVAEHCFTQYSDRHWVGHVPVTWTSKAQHGLQIVRVALPWQWATPIRVRQDTPEPGETVYGIGYAFGDRTLTVTRGVVSHVSPYDEDRRDGRLNAEMWFDATLIHGMSGGAIVDEHGDLVSICQGLWAEAGMRLAHGPQTSDIRKMLKGHR